MINNKSTELFINMKDVPEWNRHKHFYEQSREVLQFYAAEWQKITKGVTIGGYFFHPWLYWHINYFKTPIPVSKEEDKILNPPLDDNALYIIESYKEAEKANKGLIIFGTRGFAKSTLLTSLAQWTSTVKANGTTSIIGGNQNDLDAISSLLETAFTEVNPAFTLPTIKKDWKSQVTIGYKETAQTNIVHSNISITNANKGGKNESEKGAGLTPKGYIQDEIGKYDCLGVFESAIPSFRTPYGYRLTPVLSGCVCAGTKVWNNEGDLVNIEDLNPEKGILGYNTETFEVSKEPITYWQPPHEKECYKIETASGRTLECSDDHPIFVRERNKSKYIHKDGVKVRVRWTGFVEAKDLKVGTSIGISSFLPFEGKNTMWEPRFTGWLIGDGTYGYDKSTRLSSCDDEVNDYIQVNFDCTVERGYLTKEGKEYKETNIRGIRKHLTSIGIASQVKDKKRLPINIHSYTHNSICELLGGFFDADGHVIAEETKKSRNYSVNLSSGHKEILIEVQLLLQRLGIHGRVHFKKDERYRSIAGGKKFLSKGHYVLNISDKRSVIEFGRNINFFIKYKQDKLVKAISALEKQGDNSCKEYTNMRFEPVKSIERIGKKPVFNLTAGNTHTYIANGIITHNTGGNTSLSQDAKKMLTDPEAYDLMMCNYDLLERNVPEEAITWKDTKKKKFSVFVPAQMSLRVIGEVLKIDTTLDEFMGIKHPDLKKIKVKQTDWLKTTRTIKAHIDGIKDRDSKARAKMYNPLDIDDCFLTNSFNPFPETIIRRHIDYLEEKGKIGKDVEIIKENGSNKAVFINRPRAEVSHSGGSADAPIILFGELPEKPPVKGMNVSGLDGYKLDASDSDSLGSLYVLNRRYLTPNSPCETILCSYTARPQSGMKEFHQNAQKVIEAFSAECLMESVDMGFKQFLDHQNKTEQLLAPAINFNSIISHNNKLNSKYGLYPSKQNNEYRFNLLVEYCKEIHVLGIDEDGNEITKYGVEFIDDVDLLKEMLDYHKDGNYDRITAFSHALVYARELDKHNIRPRQERDINEITLHKKVKTVGKYGKYRPRKRF